MTPSKDTSNSPKIEPATPFPDGMSFRDRLLTDLARTNMPQCRLASISGVTVKTLSQWATKRIVPRLGSLAAIQRIAVFFGRDVQEYLAAPDLVRLVMLKRMREAPPKKCSPMGRHLDSRKLLAQDRKYGTTIARELWTSTAKAAYADYVCHKTGKTVRDIPPSTSWIADKPSEHQPKCSVDVYASWHGSLYAFGASCRQIPIDDIGIHLWAIADLVIDLTEDYREHIEGNFYNSTTLDIVSYAMGLLNAKTGWLPKNPRFISSPQFVGQWPTTATSIDLEFKTVIETPLTGTEPNYKDLAWREICRLAHQRLADHAISMRKHNRIVGRSNLQQDAHMLGHALVGGDPCSIYHQLNSTMLKLFDAADPNSHEAEVLARDLALYSIFQCCPGRTMQISAMKLGEELISLPGRRYQILIHGCTSKNRRGKWAQAPVDITIPYPKSPGDLDINLILWRYLEVFRPRSLQRHGCGFSPYVFLSTRKSKRTHPLGALSVDLVRSRLTYLLGLATAGQAPGAGARIFRKIGAGILEVEGRGDEASDLLRNSPTIARKYYREPSRQIADTKKFKKGQQVIRTLAGQGPTNPS